MAYPAVVADMAPIMPPSQVVRYVARFARAALPRPWIGQGSGCGEVIVGPLEAVTFYHA